MSSVEQHASLSAGSDVAASIVEAHAYAYVYKAVAPKVNTGANLIVPLRLATETLGVLGTRMAAAKGGGSCVMLLTEESIITIRL